MKKKLLLVSSVMLCLMSFISSAQTYSSWGIAINQNNNMYDTISASGDSLKFKFPSTPATAWGIPKLVVYYEGNFDSGHLQAFDETLTNFGSTNYSTYGYNCSPEDSTVFNLTTTNINTWNANNSIVFTFIPNVGPSGCLTNRVRARLVYNYCLSGIPLQYATPSISNSSVCALDGPYTLTGIPTGGIFSGPGVSGTTFNALTLSAGNYVISYTAADSHSCTSTGTLSVQVKIRPIVNNNNTIYACQSSTVNLNATIGNNFIWFSDAALSHPLDTTKVFTTPTLTQTTNYWVAALDQNNHFKLDTVKNSNFGIVDENNLAGDDRGGMAITKTHIYLNGDDHAVRYDLNLTPSSGVSLPIRDGMFSDLRTGKIWSLWNTVLNVDPQNSPSNFNANALRGLDSNLNFTNEYIYLSETLDLGTNNNQNGIFAGFGYLGLYSGDTQHWYVVDMDNGNVSDIGFLNDPQFNGSENWSDWGVLEATCGGTFSVIYRDYNDANIHRRVLPNGPVTSIGTFPDLSDMASLTYDPWNHRWYWHYENSSSTFGGNQETLGYADATDSTSICNGSNLSCPTKVVVNVPAKVMLTLPTNTICINNDAIPLNGGAPTGGNYSGIGVGTNTAGTVFYPALAGTGTFTITYTHTDILSGCTDSGTNQITVNACTGIEEHILANGVTVFPNPNNGSFYISTNNDINSLFIEISDVQGRIIFTSQEINMNAGIAHQINLNTIDSGLYFMKMKTTNEQHIQRISVIH